MLNININNSGTNAGMIVGSNTGTINYLSNQPIRITSMLSSVIKLLGSICIENGDNLESEDLKAFKPDEKLEYNCIIKYKEVIKEHATYYSICDEKLNVFDDSNLGSKAKILRCVRNWYLESRGQLLLELKGRSLKDIEKIRNNADKLIDAVINKMKNTIFESANIVDATHEEILLGITCFVCYCFMECKIMERPE